MAWVWNSGSRCFSARFRVTSARTSNKIAGCASKYVYLEFLLGSVLKTCGHRRRWEGPNLYLYMLLEFGVSYALR